MSHSRSNHPADKSQVPPDRERTQGKDRNVQSSEELNTNEERTSPSGKTRSWNYGKEAQRHDSSQLRNQTAGSNVPGSEITDRNRGQSTSINPKGYTGNSERSGQQYSVEGNSSQETDRKNRSQNKDQLDRSHGAESSDRERRQNLRGMNATGMKNDRQMDQSRDQRKNLSNVRDTQSDQLEGEE